MSVRGKLVRDRIPDIISAAGGTPDVRVLDDAAYIDALNAKLAEELAEWAESADVAELVDLVEVALALAAAHGVSPAELETLRQAKRADRGGFERQLFLVEPLQRAMCAPGRQST